MKKLLFFLLFIPMIAMAQQYTMVVEIPNKTADQLYGSAKEWFAITFNSSNDVIQLADPIDKKIIAKGLKQVELDGGSHCDVYFTMIIQCKDNRYKYDLQSSEIQLRGGESLTYEQLKELGTEDGLKANYKAKGFSMWMYNKKDIQTLAEQKIHIKNEIENQLQEIPVNLTLALKKQSSIDNW